jgi:DNA-directed RNA polymerase subunit RPC12/RpoP
MKEEKPMQLWRCPRCGNRFLSNEDDAKCGCKCGPSVLEGRSIVIYFHGPPKKPKSTI